jgi:hypothetical protein
MAEAHEPPGRAWCRSWASFYPVLGLLASLLPILFLTVHLGGMKSP